MDEEGGEKSFNIQLLKYNIEFNKQEELTIVPSVGKIIISLFRAIFPLLLIVVWWEIDIFFHPLREGFLPGPNFEFTQWELFFPFRIISTVGGGEKRWKKSDFDLMISSGCRLGMAHDSN